MASGIDDFLTGSSFGKMAINSGISLLGDVFDSRKKRRQSHATIRASEEEAEKDLMDAYTALEEDLAGSYATSGLAPTYQAELSKKLGEGQKRTKDSYSKAYKNAADSSRSTLGGFFFGRK